MNGARRLTSLFFPAALALSLPAQAAKPLIDTVFANTSLTAITINGDNLAGTTVFLGGIAAPLAVTSSSNSQIMASLPAGLAPGSYAVRVQGHGNGNSAEFFSTFFPPASGTGICTSYANSTLSGAFAASLSITEPGSYALSANATVNNFAAPAGGFARCTLDQVSPALQIDEAFGSGTFFEMSMSMQGTITTTVPNTQLQVTCTSNPLPPGGGTVSVYHSKITAVCLPSLVSPSP